MSRLVTSLVLIALVGTALSGTTWGSATSTVLLVGYEPGNDDAAHAAIVAAGGSVRRSSPELGFAVVETSDPDSFRTVASLSPFVQYVEDNDATRLSGAQWNGAQWNGAQWNGAQWNGAQWNGAQWNGAQWNGAQWNGGQYNATVWTVHHFRAGGAHASFAYDRETSDPGIVWQWGSWATRVPDAWGVTTGSRTADLCVIDSGVAWDHPDLAANAWTGPLGEHGWNAIDPSASAYDDAGHGTHIAGIAAAVVGNAYGIAGVANAKIMAAKVLDQDGNGVESDLAFALVWCANNGADVAVMALSATERGPTLDRALQYAADRDVLMLASAGNDGPCADCVAFPADDPRVMAVAAIDGTGALAPFSNTGPEIELFAPGVDILGTFPGDAFVFGSGTSQAVALAAGVASMVRDAHPELTAYEARGLLAGSARPLDVEPEPGAASGLVDAPGALALAASA